MRFASLVTYFAIIFFLFAIAFHNLINDGEFTSPAKRIAFKLDKCSLHILDHNSDTSEPVYVSYHIPKELKIDQSTIVDIKTDTTPQTVTILNALDPRYCLVKLFVKESTPLDSLQIDCQRCNVTQDTSFQLEITNALTIQGDSIHANFRNVKVGSLDYQSNSGYLQLSNIESLAAVNTITMNYEGDVIIQSTVDLTADVTTETQAFCFYGPSVTKQSNANCAILSNSPSIITFIENLLIKFRWR